MFATREIVPVPGGAALVVTGNLLNPEWRALSEFRRKRDPGKTGGERVREINDANVATRKLGDEFIEKRSGHIRMIPLECQFTLERFRVVPPTGIPLLSNVARIDIFDPCA